MSNPPITKRIKSIPADYLSGETVMCSGAGGFDVELTQRLKPKKYKCRSCGATFESVSKHPVCPTCQSESVDEV